MSAYLVPRVSMGIFDSLKDEDIFIETVSVIETCPYVTLAFDFIENDFIFRATTYVHLESLVIDFHLVDENASFSIPVPLSGNETIDEHSIGAVSGLISAKMQIQLAQRARKAK